jgi:ribosomal protein S24E
MGNYFSKITHDHWVSKNNLQKAAHKVAQEMDRKIITEELVEDFKTEFKEKISKLNAEFYRCKPVHLSIEKDHMDKGDVIFRADGIFCLVLFLSKN